MLDGKMDTKGHRQKVQIPHFLSSEGQDRTHNAEGM